MKKIYAVALLVFIFQMVDAQPFTSIWTKAADGAAFTWFSPDNSTQSLAYNPATDKLLVSKRGNAIYILNPLTGAEEGQLSTTGVGGEAFKYSKIRVTTDGVIYAVSLATGAGQSIIYRWANQAANPTQCASITVTERAGDSFGLSGTGINTILYVSGAGTTGGNTNIYVVRTFNGTNFFLESNINIVSGGQQWANRAIDPVSNALDSDLWVKTSGQNARRITVGPNVGNTRTGTVAFTTTDGVGNGQISVGYGGMRYMPTPNGNKFLIFGGGNNSNAGTRMKVISVADEADVTTFGLDSLYTGDVTSQYVTNANGTGDASYKLEVDGSYTIFYLGVNNGMQATNTGLTILPVTLKEFRVGMRNGNQSLLSWSTSTETNSTGFEVEKSRDGKDFTKMGFVASKASNGNSTSLLNYQYEDQNVLLGRTYYRLKQMDKDGKSAYSEVKFVENSGTAEFSARLLVNPVRDNILVNIQSKESGQVQLQLTNASGAVVLAQRQQVVAGDNMVSIPVSNMPVGMMFLQVNSGNAKGERVTLKVLKN